MSKKDNNFEAVRRFKFNSGRHITAWMWESNGKETKELSIRIGANECDPHGMQITMTNQQAKRLLGFLKRKLK